MVRGFVGKARRMNVAVVGSGTKWLEELNDKAVEAVASGDEEVTSMTYEGGSQTTARRFNSQELLEVTTLALEEITADPTGSNFAPGPSLIDRRHLSAL